MQKISLVSLRLRPRRLPPTASERRAWERAQQDLATEVSGSGNQSFSTSPALPQSESPAVATDTSLSPVVATDTSLAPSAPLPARVGESTQIPAPPALPSHPPAPPVSEPELDMPLTVEQSHALRELDVWTQDPDLHDVPLSGKLIKADDSDHMVVQLSVGSLTSDVPQMLSVSEVCERLKMTQRTVIRLFREMKLPSYRFGKQYRVAESDLNEFLRKHRLAKTEQTHTPPESSFQNLDVDAS